MSSTIMRQKNSTRLELSTIVGESNARQRVTAEFSTRRTVPDDPNFQLLLLFWLAVGFQCC